MQERTVSDFSKSSEKDELMSKLKDYQIIQEESTLREFGIKNPAEEKVSEDVKL